MYKHGRIGVVTNRGTYSIKQEYWWYILPSGKLVRKTRYVLIKHQ